MVRKALQHRFTLQHGAFAIGVILVAVALVLLTQFAASFSEKQTMAMTIGSELPALRSKVAMLDASVEAQRIYGGDADASREEQAQVYILPDEFDTAKAVRSLQEVALALEDGIKLDGVTFAKDPIDSGTLQALPATVTIHGTAKQVARFLRVLDLSGKFTVRDALTAETVTKLLTQFEEVSPLSLKQAEQFLYVDLIVYASNPDEAESRMLKDINPSAAIDIRSFLLKSGLSDIRSILSDIALPLKDKRIWPLPLIKVLTVEQTGDKWVVGVELLKR
jgi:Tfp pilus assembly protein PilN